MAAVRLKEEECKENIWQDIEDLLKRLKEDLASL